MGRAHKGQSESTKAGRWSRILGWCALGAGVIVGLSFSCTGPSSPPQEPPQPQPGGGPPSTSPAEEKPEDETTSYAEAIRRRNFKRAAWLIDGATEEERKAPEVRYARARVALELGDVETALRQVNELEEVTPLFKTEAEAVRAQAAKQSHDVSLLSAFMSPDPSASELLILAEAHLESSSPLEGRKAADRALKELAREEGSDAMRLRARAHLLRAECFRLEGQRKQAAAEFRWLATEAAGVLPSALGIARSFEDEMRALDPEQELTRDARIERARTFSKEGWADRTSREVEAIEAMGAAFAEGTGLLAWAVYVSRTDYEKASELFALAAEREPREATRHRYYEAKALARSHRDSEAIDKYEAVSRRGGRYAEHAGFQAARLRFIDGQWAESVEAFGAYLKTYGMRARHADDARYSRAVARLAAKQYEPAVAELQKLLNATKSSRTRAQLMQLQAVGLWGAGQQAEATTRLREVIDLRPLSFAALLAEARLRLYGEQVPPRILPAGVTPKPHSPLKLALPEKVWRLNRVGLDSEAEQALRADEPRLRDKFGAHRHEALCRLYGQLKSAKRRYQIAQYAATWAHLRVAPSPGTRWEWNCIYPEPYAEIVDQHAKLRRVSPALIYAVMRQESAFRPTVVSPADAVGLMQIIPPTAARIAEEIGAQYVPDAMRSPATNVRFGAYYLRRLLDLFGDRPELAAAAYNAGPHALSRWLRAGESLPLDLFVARIPYSETRGYVYRVMGNLARYAYLEDPDSVPVFDLDLPKGLVAPDDAY